MVPSLYVESGPVHFNLTFSVLSSLLIIEFIAVIVDQIKVTNKNRSTHHPQRQKDARGWEVAFTLTYYAGISKSDTSKRYDAS